jgi:predicted ATP-dependent protease
MTQATRKKTAVPTGKLRHTCDPRDVENAQPIEGVLGQQEALEAVGLGLDMSASAYERAHDNVVVVGPEHMGRGAKTLEYLRARARNLKCTPPDLLLLPNLDKISRPTHAYVPAGTGRALNETLAELAHHALEVVPGLAVETNLGLIKAQYQLRNELAAKNKKLLAAVGHVVIETEEAYELKALSLSKPGEVMSAEEREALPPDIREKIFGEYGKKAVAIIDASNEAIQKVAQETSRDFFKVHVTGVISASIEALTELATDANYRAYLGQIGKLLISAAVHGANEGAQKAAQMMLGENEDDECEGCGGHCDHDDGDEGEDEDSGPGLLKKLAQVNILVDNTDTLRPPVVYVDAPKFGGLHGRVNPKRLKNDYVKIDHTMVEAGLIHRASGTPECPGTILVDILDLIEGSGGWYSLKKLLHTVKTGKAQIESIHNFVMDGDGLNFQCPEIPVYVRVVVTCTSYVNAVLRQIDPQFDNLFRIVAEFDSTMPIEEAAGCYKSFVARCRAQDPSLLEFQPAAVARLVEHGSRLADSQLKATAKFGLLKDIIAEAAYLAKKAGASEVGAEHVTSAIKARFRRVSLWARKYREYMDRGTILLDLEGKQVGQVNGLVVMGSGHDSAIGAPARVTARTYPNDGGLNGKVMLVQREAETSGSSTNTATGIIRGWLCATYGSEKPFGLTANVCFEQCLDGLDGDSATLAETIAIVSSITGLPVNQRFAITGSMNQMGEAQPIGGLKYKFEGFLNAVKGRGLLKGGHGLIMPVQNLPNLVLDEEVVEAQRQGLLQIYAVTTIDEALEILLDTPIAEIHRLAKERLAKLGKKEKKSPWSQICFWRK